MDALVSIWWVWLAAALGLAVLEVLIPGFIFLGFAIGAVAMTVLVALFPTLMSAPIAIAVFTGLSLAAWMVLRVMFRKQSSGARRVTHDIND
jgi:membrane protein implicated in regulation of membrane protease activity